MTLKNTFKTNLDSIHKQLTEVSDWMYENPELGFNEFKTSEYLVNFIESFNGKVAYPTGGLILLLKLPTATKAHLSSCVLNMMLYLKLAMHVVIM